MSKAYDRYLEEHAANVAKGFEWLSEHIPSVIDGDPFGRIASIYDRAKTCCCVTHDASKTDADEYDAYDDHFYGTRSGSPSEVKEFNKAWLHHIHNNPHHWQYWCIINDDPKDGGITCVEMPRWYVIEMICDWWSFSWKKDNLYEIFDWYEERKDHIKLHNNTRKLVETILDQMKKKLLQENGGFTE